MPTNREDYLRIRSARLFKGRINKRLFRPVSGIGIQYGSHGGLHLPQRVGFLNEHAHACFG